MARKDALLRLHKRLVTQRNDLREKLRGEIKLTRSGAGTSDVADLAADDAEQEISSQLAAFEWRELAKVERAIEAIREGHYGTCDVCGRKIPIARLQALPYTSSCVDCQRQQEQTGGGYANADADWESAIEFQSRQNDTELTLSDIDIDA